MKFLIFFFPFLVFAEINNDCDHSCNESPVLNKIIFTPPNQENINGIINISGKYFPSCVRQARVTFAGKALQILSINSEDIQAQINAADYQNGSYKIQVNKTNCQNKIGVMDATISIDSYTSGPGSEFTTRKSSQVAIYPYSYAEVNVACNPDEMAISGGFIFSTWEVKLVSSYPEGRNWKFKVYNNESLISSFNEFYAVCVR